METHQGDDMSTALTTQSGGALAISDQELMGVLRYDRDTGIIYWAIRSGRSKPGNVAGTVKTDGYIQIRACGGQHYAHRIAWLFEHGKWPDGHIDHIDGDPTNNRISNLRDVSIGMNMENQRHAHVSNKSSGLLGVSFDKQTGRWMAKISVSNKTKNLGRFSDQNKAHEAYVAAKRQLHPGATI
jgi:hypothetical protein